MENPIVSIAEVGGEFEIDFRNRAEYEDKEKRNHLVYAGGNG